MIQHSIVYKEINYWADGKVYKHAFVLNNNSKLWLSSDPHFSGIMEWLETMCPNRYHFEGTVLLLLTDQDAMNFKLRWA